MWFIVGASLVTVPFIDTLRDFTYGSSLLTTRVKTGSLNTSAVRIMWFIVAFSTVKSSVISQATWVLRMFVKIPLLSFADLPPDVACT